MQPEQIIKLIEAIQAGSVSTEEALEKLKTLPFEEVGNFARLDNHRALRCGFPEVVFGVGKTNEQICAIVERLLLRDSAVLVTRVTPEMARSVQMVHPRLVYNPDGRVLTWQPTAKTGVGRVLVLTGGTADIPVAEEAAVTAEMMGAAVERIFDVGVAGLHRLLRYLERLQRAHVIVACAGMEGALPSVVAGLVNVPVIAVPTSVGYGASFQGLAALLAMLNSCANGVSVVNIDNGFGAGYQAALINRQWQMDEPCSS
jgi:NCAIR mutase (PurE)-related protein